MSKKLSGKPHPRSDAQEHEPTPANSADRKKPKKKQEAPSAENDQQKQSGLVGQGSAAPASPAVTGAAAPAQTDRNTTTATTDNAASESRVGMLVLRLNPDISHIYRDTIKRMSHGLPGAEKFKQHFFADDNESATMLINVPDKYTAKKLAAKIAHANLYGEHVHTTVVPTGSLQPTYAPCAVKITELRPPNNNASSKNNNNTSTSSTTDVAGAHQNNNNNNSSSRFTIQQLQQYLMSSNPGFLAVTRVTSAAASGGSHAQANVMSYIATFADSGAALQARALLSGRPFHGTHLLLERVQSESEVVVPV